MFDWVLGSVTDWVSEGIAGLAAIAINSFISLFKLFMMSWALRDTVGLVDDTGEGEDGPSSATAVDSVQDQIFPLVAVIAVCGLIAASARLAWTRRADPLTNVLSGILTLAVTTFLGLAVAQLLVNLSDSISNRLIEDTVSTGALDLDDSLVENNLQVLAYAFFAFFVGVIGIFFLIAQMAFMLLRDASLIVLAGVLPLAAVGKMIPGTQWFEKITGWMLALIFYKPCAVMVLWVGFMLLEGGGSSDGSGISEGIADDAGPEAIDIGSEGDYEGATIGGMLDIAYTMTMGVIVLGLGLLAMPVMVKLFDFTVGHVGGFGNPGPAIMSAAANVGTAVATGGATAAAGGAAASQAGNISGALGDMSQAMEAPEQGGSDGAKTGGGTGQGGGGDGGDKPPETGTGGGGGGGVENQGGDGEDPTPPPQPGGAGGGGTTPPSSGGTPPPSGGSPGGAPPDAGPPTDAPGDGGTTGAPPEAGQNPPGGGGGAGGSIPVPEVPDISQAAESAAESTHRTDE